MTSLLRHVLLSWKKRVRVRVRVSLASCYGLGLGLGFDFTFETRPSEMTKKGLGLGFTLEVHDMVQKRVRVWFRFEGTSLRNE